MHSESSESGNLTPGMLWDPHIDLQGGAIYVCIHLELKSVTCSQLLPTKHTDGSRVFLWYLIEMSDMSQMGIAN